MFQGVRAKLTQFKLEIGEKGQQIQQLREELKLAEAKHVDQAASAVARQQVSSGSAWEWTSHAVEDIDPS